MDDILIELVIRTLQKDSSGIDLFSKEYLFDKQFAAERSKPAMFG